MVDYLINELNKRLEIEDMKYINWEKTRELQKQDKYVNFHKWLKEQGARYDSIEYPVAFGKGGHLIGIAANKDIGPEEAYLYVPTSIIINDEKVYNSKEIGHIVKRHEDVFKEHADGEYLRLIFFMAYEISKGERSLWAPYFAITEETDLPCFWDDKDIQELEDELLKAEIKEYKEEYDAEYEALFEVASLYPDIIDITKFTEATFRQAFTICVTRCFGWSLPSTMVVPFADCANHFIIDNQYELFNSKLHKLRDQAERQGLSEDEQKYFTQIKMRINCYKHFTNDIENGDDNINGSQNIQHQIDNGDSNNNDTKFECPYKTKRYIRKLKMREECLKIKADQFIQDDQYKDKQIWELKYVSTSDDEDNDSSDDDDDKSSDEEENQEKSQYNKEEESKQSSLVDLLTTQTRLNDNDSTKATTTASHGPKYIDLTQDPTPPEKIWKEDTNLKSDNIPQIAKKLRPAKKKQRVYFTYSYNNKTGEGGPDNQQQDLQEPKKNVIVKKRVEGRQPENLIDLLVMQKHYMYEQEQRMKILKDQDDEEWSKMTEEYNSSEEEDDEENFAWYQDGNKDTYFVLCTKYKNVYKKGQQVFHCYGRRTNRFLLLNYGFCLNNNKYNSLSFRVWINFNWQLEREKDEQRKLKAEREGKIIDQNNDNNESDNEDNDETANRISKIIRLKKERLSEEIFAYIRANLLNTYKGKNLEYLLVSSPVDAEFEMLVVACTINLLKGLMSSRFRSPLEEDQKLLQDPNLPIRKRFAVLHRINAKEVLQSNIRLCEILMRILARFQDGRFFKHHYMRIVEDFEIDNDIMLNRLKLRKYLRELVVNQKRVLDVALNQEYVQRVKEYFDEKKREEEEKKREMEEQKDQEDGDGEENDEYYDEEDEEEGDDK